MGFKSPIDYNSVSRQIYTAGVELRSFHNDGFTQWEIKKSLYNLKWLLDEIIKDSSTFTGEQEFIMEHEKSVVLKELSR